MREVLNRAPKYRFIEQVFDYICADQNQEPHIGPISVSGMSSTKVVSAQSAALLSTIGCAMLISLQNAT